MKIRKYKGKDIGDSAVAFFEKLAFHESAGKYSLSGDTYIGRYQIGVDILKDMGWCTKSTTSWKNIKFIGEALKYNLSDKKSFLDNYEAQDIAIMESIKKRWNYVKSLEAYICKEIYISNNANFKTMKKVINDSNVNKVINAKNVIANKMYINIKCKNPKNRHIRVTSSGLLGSSHLCGQGAVADALKNKCMGVYGIPTDGNSLPFSVYMEDLGGYDLSIIIGYKDLCQTIESKPILKNESKKDTDIIDISTIIKKKVKNKATEIKEKSKNEDKSGVYESNNSEKFEEINENNEYNKEIYDNKRPPKRVFIDETEIVIKRLEEKFNANEYYKSDYIKYVEEKTKRKIYSKHKKYIDLILKCYDKETQNENDNKIGRVIRQYGFDKLRGLNYEKIEITIDEIVYYMYFYPIRNKSGIETLEIIFNKFSAKYVHYPAIKPIEIEENNKVYINTKIKEYTNKNEKQRKIIKNELSKEYDKYKEGMYDIDEIEFLIDSNIKSRCEYLLKAIKMTKEHGKSYSLDENNIYKYPKARRFLNNMLEELVMVKTSFKKYDEKKYFDNHKYKDSNIIRNYLIWYDEKYGIQFDKGIDDGIFDKLLKLSSEIRVTTLLNEWINSKSNRKKEQIKKMHILSYINYTEYTDTEKLSIDKSIVQSHFKTLKELRDYFANIDAINIYSFYKEFYSIDMNLKENEEYYVNSNGILICTFGNGTSNLIINERKETLHGAKKANISDINIKPFKRCQDKGCTPKLIGNWQKMTNTNVEGVPALLDTSTVKCIKGGIISVDDPGQKQVKTAVTTNQNITKTKREYECEYKSFEEICCFVNNNFMQTNLKNKCVEFSINKTKYEKYKFDMNNMIKRKEELEKIKTKSENSFDFSFSNGINKLKNSSIENEIRALDEKIKNSSEKDEKKIVELYNKTTEEKEKQLYYQILNTRIEALSYAINMSKPLKDNKLLYKNYGTIACDTENSSFYNVSILSGIVYGYLMEAAGIYDKYNKDNNSSNLKNKNNEERLFDKFINLNKYTIEAIVNLKNKKENKEGESKLILEDNRKIEQIGVKLYRNIKGTPLPNDILKEIRKEIKSELTCPFIKLDDKKNELCPRKSSSAFIFYVERIKVYGDSTLSKFYIKDSYGIQYSEYDGYIIEPGGPDTLASGRNKRIVEGEHKLMWHYRSKKKHLYFAPLIYSSKISKERYILIHPGTSRGYSLGCLIVAPNYTKDVSGKYGNVFFVSGEDKYGSSKRRFELICNKIIEIEGKSPKSGRLINNIILKVINNINN